MNKDSLYSIFISRLKSDSYHKPESLYVNVKAVIWLALINFS